MVLSGIEEVGEPAGGQLQVDIQVLNPIYFTSSMIDN